MIDRPLLAPSLHRFSVSSSVQATVEACELLLCQIPHLVSAAGLGGEVKTYSAAQVYE